MHKIILEHSHIVMTILLLPVLYVILHRLRIHFYRKRLLSCSIEQIDQLSGRDFEYFLYYFFRKHKVKTQITSYTHDYGADLVLKYKHKKYVLQAKRYNESVGIKAVQETSGALSYYHADYGIVITNSYFTKSAYELAKACNILLIGRNDLCTMIDLEKKEIMPFIFDLMNDSSVQIERFDSRICPYCGGRLVKRNGKYGTFLGCSNYPNCSYTRDINET